MNFINTDEILTFIQLFLKKTIKFENLKQTLKFWHNFHEFSGQTTERVVWYIFALSGGENIQIFNSQIFEVDQVETKICQIFIFLIIIITCLIGLKNVHKDLLIHSEEKYLQSDA